MLDVKKTRTAMMAPRSNGMIERFNRSLGAMLTMYAERQQKRWDRYLPLIMMAYRASVHSSTGKNPNEMMFGRQVMMPMQVVIPQPEEEVEEQTSDGYVAELKEHLRDTHEQARKHLKKSAQYQKRNYNVGTRTPAYMVGQPVWVLRPTRKVGVCAKLTSPWKGPYVIVQVLDDVTCRVQAGPRATPKVYHVDRLKLYKGRRPPGWWRPSSS